MQAGTEWREASIVAKKSKNDLDSGAGFGSDRAPSMSTTPAGSHEEGE